MKLVATLLGVLLSLGVHAAPVIIYDQDAGTNSGFDSGEVVAPAPGNEATTLGGQRLRAVRYAASIVGSRVASTVPIRVAVSFAGKAGGVALECSTNSATLGQGGATQYAVNFPGAPRADTGYPLALANALAERRLADTKDIALSFNPALDTGDADCLQGYRWYYGLDGKPGDHEIDFVATAVHELIHGLGFQSLVALTNTRDAKIGQFPRYGTSQSPRFPDIYSRFIRDLSLPGQPLWTDLTAAQRATSIGNGPSVVWADPTTSNAAAGYLTYGLNQGRVELYAPATIQPGSSISHWAIALSPDQIMEPRENPGVDVLHGLGMASCLLENMGWQLANGTRCPDVNSTAIAGRADVTIAGAAAAESENSDPSGDEGDNDDDSGGGGGGCTVNPNAAFDPLWALMLIVACGVLVWRRRRVTA
ncbi:JDVT-CTERM domain-containing protein [Salinisphaera sp.]|uniref:JDVT-CTERM domain-containing protein n=1 Tax=Salinisphaera sp. TaxID=1914330 RepID=UPI002D78C59F|nr:JDVT-CTERM domain-containing protein [Salinisphaera sp.]HET7314544.1 JDVT-CTERM domain-containing protein [Salinisphaera sp.]